jgi:hypothetical protein
MKEQSNKTLYQTLTLADIELEKFVFVKLSELINRPMDFTNIASLTE